MAERYKTVIQKLEEVTTPAIARFIVYYYTPEDKRKSWDEFKTCHDLIKKRTYDECLEWLTREDAQIGMQVYQKHMKIYNMTKLYDSMLDKAMNGDVNAAKWVEQFTHSDYFDESEDEIDTFLSNVNIPGLKKGG
jgi:hypothetical protein